MADEVKEPAKPKKDIHYNCAEIIGDFGDNERYPKKVSIGNWGKGGNKISIRNWQKFTGATEMSPAKGIELTVQEAKTLLEEKLLEKAIEAMEKNSPKE